MKYYKVELRTPATGDPVGLYYDNGTFFFINGPGYVPTAIFGLPPPEEVGGEGVPVDAFLKAIAIVQDPQLARELLK